LGLSGVRLRLTKGIHLVFDHARLPVTDAVVITEGTRILFVIPWGERVIVGTTDTDYSGPIEAVRTEWEDVDYLLKTVNEFFPEARLNPLDVISSWAGLRPLIARGEGKPSDISRSHRIDQTEPGWWDVSGGKLTTYRLMAEQTVDRITVLLGGKFDRCKTAEQPLLAPEEVAGMSGIIPPPPSRKSVEHFSTREWAVHLDDVMMRRSGWHYYFRNAAAIAEQTATWMQSIHGWTSDQREQELHRYRSASDWPVRRTSEWPMCKDLETVAHETP
ncbi:MAG: FAD-dependent oxidoreductase, partial [Verrucomicrobiota bacterium]